MRSLRLASVALIVLSAAAATRPPAADTAESTVNEAPKNTVAAPVAIPAVSLELMPEFPGIEVLSTRDAAGSAVLTPIHAYTDSYVADLHRPPSTSLAHGSSHLLNRHNLRARSGLFRLLNR